MHLYTPYRIIQVEVREQTYTCDTLGLAFLCTGIFCESNCYTGKVHFTLDSSVCCNVRNAVSNIHIHEESENSHFLHYNVKSSFLFYPVRLKLICME